MALLTDIELTDVLEALNPMQMLFSELYVNKNLSGGEACRRAGYASASRYVQSARLLANDNVKAYVEHLKSVQAVEAEVTAAALMAELKPVAFQDVTDFLEFNEFGDVGVKSLEDLDTRAIKKISIKKGKGEAEGDIITVELHDKLKAIEMLGKTADVFKDKLDLTSAGEKLATPVVESKIFINHRRAGEKIEDSEK